MSLLDELIAEARERAKSLPLGDAPRADGERFRRALRGKERISVIAEYKQASPSAGAIAIGRDVVMQAEAYVDAGAAAISVLTEPARFAGKYSDLEQVSARVAAPTLMKDFIVDPAQVVHAARLGASAVLLIARCLPGDSLSALARIADACGLACLIECHTASEIDRALAIDAAVIGVNNRDLDTLTIDRALCERLLPNIPNGRIVVAESGYDDASQLESLVGAVDAVLIGSALMRCENPRDLIQSVAQLTDLQTRPMSIDRATERQTR